MPKNYFALLKNVNKIKIIEINTMLQAPQNTKPKILVPQGTRIARVVGLIHIGTVSENYMGEQKMMNKINLTFEFPDELHVFKEGSDATPLVHSQEYTLSMGKKSNLRPIVEGIIGTSLMDTEAYSFDFENIVNKACLVTIKHGKSQKGVEYARISSTSPLMKGQEAKLAFNPIKVLTYEKWDEKYFESLPSFIKDKMKTSEEYKKMKNIDVTVNEIPF